MKTIHKSILFVSIFAIVTLIASSCKDDNNSSSGAPFISYVRVTNPASSDSLLAAAGQGQMIAIVGGNLQNTRQVWFNDQQTTLIPTYVTNTTLIVTVPSSVPMVVTDKMKLVFADGDSLLYDFQVTINAPIIDDTYCDYVADEATDTIYGRFFYYPLTVTFPGGLSVSSGDSGSDDVTVQQVDPNTSSAILMVKVPIGAQPGQITVTSNFGSGKSNFMFRDNRNIFEGFDDGIDPGTNGTVVTDPGPSDPPSINGAYVRIAQTIGGWAWIQVFARWNGDVVISSDAILHPDLYNFKFEVCTEKPFNTNGIRGWITDPAIANNTPATPVVTSATGTYYSWIPTSADAPSTLTGTFPPIDTQGTWKTITIPLDQFAAAEGSYFPGVLPSYFCAFVFCEGGTLDCDMSFDNFRIVPKTIAGN